MNPSATVDAVAEQVTPSERIAGAWTVWVALTSVTSILVGAYWDISWHMSIGRDTFWTPAHLAIQFGGVLAAGCSAALIFATTFGKRPAQRDASIRVWGFRGPLGAFLCAWGGIAMGTSAPFDNWWHDAYGLDVKILSPPHMVLNLGVLGICTGGLLLILSAMNRAGPAQRRTYERVMLLVGGEMLVLNLIAVWERTFRVHLHSGHAYLSVAIVVPGLMFALARASDERWAATRMAAVYSGLLLAGLWIMPLFPAEPKLGPVYQPITHFVPLEFPLLVIVPALLVDVLRARLAGWRPWAQALLLGPAFIVSFIAVQWPFADFLLSKAAANRIFGTGYFPYFIPPWFLAPRREFLTEAASTTVTLLLIAVAASVLSTGLGLAIGNAMRKVRR